ncbi:MAG: hypothetical protein JNK54_04440 [Elusimicrobia bacterium]|mgnify:CR=1 FL=1|jgi:hypothetical protein|nr:hypothetical protein [Elusimicrobiota bacterium]
MLGKKTVVKKKRVTGEKTGVVAPKTRPPVARAEALLPSPEALGKNYIGIDFPQVGEILTSPHYALRVSTSATDGVEVSVDGKEWQPCRECVGFWWYDWSGYGSGVHTVVARITVGKRTLKSKPRSFTVIV